MRLKTIWTISAMSTKERFRRTWDLGFQTLAGKLPKRLRFWVTIQTLASVTSKMPDAVVPSIRMEDILKHLDSPKGLN